MNCHCFTHDIHNVVLSANISHIINNVVNYDQFAAVYVQDNRYELKFISSYIVSYVSDKLGEGQYEGMEQNCGEICSKQYPATKYFSTSSLSSCTSCAFCTCYLHSVNGGNSEIGSFNVYKVC